VAVKPDGFLKLQLQVLPSPAATVSSKPILRMDDITVVVLAAWDLDVPSFEGEGPVRGPMPVIFAESPEAVRSAIDQEEDSFGWELNMFMKRYVASKPIDKNRISHNSIRGESWY
jgi:hypothetical protein